MKFSLFAVSAALIGFVSAQTLGNVPSCAANCVSTLLPASCNLNPECICKDTAFINNISCCVFNACPASDQTNALSFAKTICTPVGVTLPAAAGCSNSTSASSSSSASAASTSGTSSGSSAGTAVATSFSASAPTLTSTAAATSTSRAAGERFAAQGISLVGALAGAIALL